jgi:hypothetical protein
MCVQLEAEAATIVDPASAPRCSKASASARAPCSAWCARRTTCWACARTSPPARRRPGRGRSTPAPSAPECAGRIHTDFQRGFIKAEVIHWDELLEIGSWAKAKELGKIRIEGKDYVLQDGDVHGVPLQRVGPAIDRVRRTRPRSTGGTRQVPRVVGGRARRSPGRTRAGSAEPTPQVARASPRSGGTAQPRNSRLHETPHGPIRSLQRTSMSARLGYA